MKAALLVALTCLFTTIGLPAERAKRPQMKGMELYSWSEGDKWLYVLLVGTNRLKSEKEVKEHSSRIDNVPALASRFKELAEGEQVVWNFHFVPGFSYPDQDTFSAVVAAAMDAKINLIADKR